MENINKLIVFLLFLMIYSCRNEPDCELEKELFQSKWNEEVRKIYKDKERKSTFVIETSSGMKISIRPIQSVITLSSPGDSIFKLENSFVTEIRTKEKDTFYSLVSSPTCNKYILRDLDLLNIKDSNEVYSRRRDRGSKTVVSSKN